MGFEVHDAITCKVRGNTIVNINSNYFDSQINLEIVGIDDKQTKFLIIIPTLYNIQGSFNIKEGHIEKFHDNPNYLDQRAIALGLDRVGTLMTVKADGMFCIKCKTFFPMAEFNQPDETFMCYVCRQKKLIYEQ